MASYVRTQRDILKVYARDVGWVSAPRLTFWGILLAGPIVCLVLAKSRWPPMVRFVQEVGGAAGVAIVEWVVLVFALVAGAALRLFVNEPGVLVNREQGIVEVGRGAGRRVHPLSDFRSLRVRPERSEAGPYRAELVRNDGSSLTLFENRRYDAAWVVAYDVALHCGFEYESSPLEDPGLRLLPPGG